MSKWDEKLVYESNDGVKIKCKIFITFNIVNNIFLAEKLNS